MKDCSLRDDSDDGITDPLPELDILRHDMALQLLLVVEVEDLQVSSG